MNHTSELLVAALEHIEYELDRIENNRVGRPAYDNPFRNSGNTFTRPEFKVRAYDWVNEEDPEPNFEWKGHKVWWYKYLGRGMYVPDPFPPEEINEMLEECMESLRRYEEELKNYYG